MVGKKSAWRKYVFVWFVVAAALFGPAFTLLSEYHYDTSLNPDLETYLQMAKGDFDQSPVRRYRPVVPLLAGGLDQVVGPVLEKVRPWTFPDVDFSLVFCFLIVNLAIMACAGCVLYYLVSGPVESEWLRLLAVAAVLSSRWAVYFSALPIVDSLYYLACTLLAAAFVKRDQVLLMAAFVVGVVSRESFLLFLPLLLVPLCNWQRRFIIGLLSITLVLGLKFLIDHLIGADVAVSIRRDYEHLGNIARSLGRLGSLHGLYEVFSILGAWWIFVFWALWDRRRYWRTSNHLWVVLYLTCILVHALMSGELARMLYLATPALVLWVLTGLNFAAARIGRST